MTADINKAHMEIDDTHNLVDTSDDELFEIPKSTGKTENYSTSLEKSSTRTSS